MGARHIITQRLVVHQPAGDCLADSQHTSLGAAGLLRLTEQTNCDVRNILTTHTVANRQTDRPHTTIESARERRGCAPGIVVPV